VEAEASTAEAIDRSIAVLPFANLSTDEENAFFAAGVHEDVIGRLAGVGDLKVISRNTVRRFANDDRGLQEIARRMGVRYVVEGSVQRSGDEIRVTAQLADSSTDETLWSESYVRQLVDVFALQSAIAEEIANTLRARITPAERRHLEAVPTVVVAAYDEFLKARPLLSSLWLSLGPIEQAIGHLDRALEADPSFAAGWALMARAQSARHAKLLEVDREEDAGQARAAAIAALERARSLDPDAAATYRAEGFFRNAVEGDKIGALRSLDQAVTIVPDDADTLFLQAWIYTELGQVNEAITVMQRAFAVDPANGLIAHGLSYALDMAGRHAELGDFYEQRLNLAPERTHFEVEAKYYRFLADGSLAAYRAFETASRTVERTEQCDLRSIKDAEMVVAMVNEEFGPYREAWKGKWEEHHAGHGDWSCPGQINDELNHAALEIEFGDPQRAQAILAQARESTPRPYSSAVCIFDRATFLPKLHFLSGDPEQARREVVEVIPKVLLNDTFPRGAVERGVLLETVDLVAPDLVYSVYRQIREKGVSAITFEGICANPWTFPNLLKDPRFIAEIREDGRFVEFLEHFELIPRVDDPA
jgi:TolB-like protein